MKKVLPKVKKIINRSMEEAKLYNNPTIKIEHIVIALINDYDNGAIKFLEELGIDIDELHKKIEKKLLRKHNKDDEPISSLYLDEEAQEIVRGAERECDNLHELYLDTPHIFLSILKENNNITKILKPMGVDYKKYEGIVKKTLIENSFEPMEDPDFFSRSQRKKTGSSKTPILDNFSLDVTKRASEGKIDPVIGRDDVIQRVAQILSRKKKNNPVLIGDPGVGKTTIIEGLALKINEGDAPRTLLDKRIISLDLTSLVAGTKYRGQFEERIKGVVDEILGNDDIILFIDELHNVVGAG